MSEPKTFPFTLPDGRTFHLKQNSLGQKEDLADRVTAARLAQCDRMEKKKLRDPDRILGDRAVAFVSYGGPGFAHSLRENGDLQRVFVRTVLVEPVDDDTLTAICQADELAAGLRRMKEDDDPKANRTPASGSTPTAGGPSS